MADDTVIIDEEIDEVEDSDYENKSSDNSQAKKYEARKKLEDYLEEKKLRELIDY